MLRRAFLLRLKDNSLTEYQYHHDQVWPELVAEIEASGIASITLFEQEPLIFLFSEIFDPEAWEKLWCSEVYERWAKLMQPLVFFNEDGTVEMTELKEIWRVQASAHPDS